MQVGVRCPVSGVRFPVVSGVRFPVSGGYRPEFLTHSLQILHVGPLHGCAGAFFLFLKILIFGAFLGIFRAFWALKHSFWKLQARVFDWFTSNFKCRIPSLVRTSSILDFWKFWFLGLFWAFLGFFLGFKTVFRGYRPQFLTDSLQIVNVGPFHGCAGALS